MRACFLSLIALLLGGAFGPTPAAAATITATLTADNYYAVYLGTGTGQDVRFIGRNELGRSGSPGTAKVDFWPGQSKFVSRANEREFEHYANRI